MKHYTSNELVKQALDLANMSNTDFLSMEELDDYINDAYQQIYASVINAGDLYWMQEAIGERTSGGNGYTDYALPYDFYAMRKLYTTGGQVISRKSPSASNGLSYDIINNQLRVYGMSNGVRLEYYPNPQRITLPFKPIDIKSDNVNAYGSDILWPYILQFNDTKAYLIDVDQNNVIEYEAPGIISRAYLGGNIIILRYLEDDEYVYEAYDYDFNTIGYIEADKILMDERNNLMYSTDDGTYLLSGNKVSNFAFNGDGVLFRNQEREMAAYIKDGFVTFNDGINEYVSEIQPDREIRYCDGYDSPYSVIAMKGGDLITIELMPDGTFHYSKTPIDGVMTLGYSNSGILEYPLKLQDWKTATTMNYPNNIFYRAIAASLAMSFIMKSGGDPSSMGAQAQAYTMQLNKMIEADATYNRIQNVY